MWTAGGSTALYLPLYVMLGVVGTFTNFYRQWLVSSKPTDSQTKTFQGCLSEGASRIGYNPPSYLARYGHEVRTYAECDLENAYDRQGATIFLRRD